MLHGELGFVNKSTKPEYRVFMTDVNAELDNFSNRLKELKEGDAVAKVTGLFMGTGRTVAAGTFGRENPDPAFDLDVRIVKTELKSFNEVLRAYANVDVSKGAFSFFSQLSVKNGQVTGYVKPIFGNVEVYDPKQDEDKAVTRKLYEAVIGGIVELLKNPRTRASGRRVGPVWSGGKSESRYLANRGQFDPKRLLQGHSSRAGEGTRAMMKSGAMSASLESSSPASNPWKLGGLTLKELVRPSLGRNSTG